MIRELINKHQTGIKFTEEELIKIVNDFTAGLISDEEMTEWLKYVVENGLSDEETLFLTKAQLNSGDILDLSKIEGIKVDKHSTGGVGDKTTLIVGPIVASLGVPVVKMSGRALGFTGGTIDKLESIKGFRVSLSEEELIKQVNEIKIAITSQTANLAPADKKIYALRDITGNVKSIALITASVMSKKLASGSDAIVLDVKFGNGAFCDTFEMAEELATKMVKIGNMYGKKTVAIITDMNQPLGFAIGNSIEVEEAIDTLKGLGPRDLTEVSIALSTEMVALAKDISGVEAKVLVEEAIANGTAYNKFIELVNYQSGNLDNLIEPYFEQEIYVEAEGYLSEVNTEKLGHLLMELGAGRKNKDDKIDYQVGITIHKKIGDFLEAGDLFMTLRVINEVEINLADYIQLVDDKVDSNPLIYKIIR